MRADVELRRAPPDGFTSYLGIESFELDPATGEVIAILPTQPHHANTGGVVHGGVLTGLLDCVMGAAVVTTLAEDEWCATQTLTTDFLRPGTPGGRLVARGRVDRRGKLAAFPSGEVRDEKGEVVARATGVWAIRRG